MENKKKTRSRQIDRKTSKQVRIDIGYHKSLKLESAELGTSIKEVIEGLLSDHYEVKGTDISGK